MLDLENLTVMPTSVAVIAGAILLITVVYMLWWGVVPAVMGVINLFAGRDE
jgi:hypothetical protein